MVIAVLRLEFFGCDVTVFEDVINHYTRSLGRDLLAQIDKCLGKFEFGQALASRRLICSLWVKR